MASPMTVGFPLYQGCTLLDFAGATQIFAFTGVFTPVWIAATADPIATTEGIEVVPNFTFDNHPELGMIFVPGGGGDGVSGAMLDPTYQGWLKSVGAKTEWVGSVCTGGLVLAASGLLDGCAATTYWSARSVLAMFPNITLLPGYPRWHVDVEKKRFSGGGISSSLDLALRLVEVIAGREVAETTQLSNQYAPGPPVNAGDPTEASPELVISVTQSQASFTAQITAAAQQVISGS
ncbi:MAG: DJ-1/PfpI family protein [Thermoanaerobaculia bacterium]|nr:DJ-1/PfpI family protein [Thermoanaerobaculia bacterium]